MKEKGKRIRNNYMQYKICSHAHARECQYDMVYLVSGLIANAFKKTALIGVVQPRENIRHTAVLTSNKVI